jgi:aminopeptidase N
MTLAYELSVRQIGTSSDICAAMESRISNPDLLREFRFIWPATNADKAVRDSVFATLLEPEGRAVEPWAESALTYLNHPLRSESAIGYIRPALDELQEIQRTGDIFFPKNWCTALLDGHDSRQAAEVVSGFIAANPDYPLLLKAKLLQAADHLLRQITNYQE